MNNLTLLLPEIFVVILGFSILTIDFFIPKNKKWILPCFAILSLTGILIFTLVFLSGKTDELYGGILRIDGYSLFFKSAFLILGGILIVSSVEYVNKNLSNQGEYYSILIFTVLAMMLMSSSGELLMAYISLEALSFGLYVLVAFDRYNIKSNEAGTKYIILGALSSAILLFGISQIYGLLGTTQFNEMADILGNTSSINPGLLIGFLFLIAGLGFKVAAVPFHMWAPDVYEGAPTPITAHLAVGSKAATFALILRFFISGLMPLMIDLQIILIIMAALTMTLGNLMALVQSNIKRLLAYSSIGHAGYLLLGLSALVSINQSGNFNLAFISNTNFVVSGIILHTIAYGISNLAAFLCISIIYKKTGHENIEDLAGIGKKSPFLSMVFAASVFSLAGLPIFAGFISKFYLFTGASMQGLIWLVAIAIFTSLISLYYYLRILKYIYIEKSKDSQQINLSVISFGLLSVLFIAMIFIGIYPAPLMDAIHHATDALSMLN
ncbi:MAG: NADH-quinone oxidoreductase subunit N [Chloroflexi bacterium]|jgi:NADH-quinone oxidoreductase subunit N|nr:MAG: NADH-quinone oxidoreductase subunit N [Chloroflexota bacterium]